MLHLANAYTAVIAALQSVGFKYSDGKNYAGVTAPITAARQPVVTAYCLPAEPNGGATFFYSSAAGFAATGLPSCPVLQAATDLSSAFGRGTRASSSDG